MVNLSKCFFKKDNNTDKVTVKPVGQKIKLNNSNSNLLDNNNSNPTTTNTNNNNNTNSNRNNDESNGTQQQVNQYEPVENKSLVPVFYPYPQSPENNNVAAVQPKGDDKNSNKKTKVKPTKAGM